MEVRQVEIFEVRQVENIEVRELEKKTIKLPNPEFFGYFCR